jgi:hypothetical protein
MILYDRARHLLGHPIGNRASDPQLAVAVVHGHLGRLRSAHPVTRSLDDGYRAARHRRPRAHVAVPRTSRVWRLYRSQQLDQGQTPHCVAYTETHWERSLPTYNRTGLTPAEKYLRAKQFDGYPTEDGTTAYAMMEVCRQLGLVHSHWWWQGLSDMDAAIRWLLDIGPLWWGAGWSESMFRTDALGVIHPTGPMPYGHETLWCGYHRNYKRLGPCIQAANSWGNQNFGLQGRFWIRLNDFTEILSHDTDLVGVIEQ